MNKDLTVIFLTNNEVPDEWMKYHNKVLLEAIDGAELIVLSRKPMDIGTINALQDKPRSLSNIYWQLLRGAKMAKTPYIAVAEDDTLYSKEHFRHRPKAQTVAYNMCHWSLFTWDTPIYSWRNRRGNYSMIGYRDAVIKALEERFEKWPKGTPDNITGELGRPMVERNLDVSHLEAEEFETTVAIININHDQVASDDLQRRHRKSLGHIQAMDIPHWGRAEDLIKHWK